jgi:hypothetical protein
MIQSPDEAHYSLLAHRILEGLTEEERESAASVFRHLVTRSGMKISYTAEDLADTVGANPARLHEVLEELASARVLRAVPPSVESNEPQATRSSTT